MARPVAAVILGADKRQAAMNNDTRVVDRLARALAHEGEDIEVTQLAVLGMQDLLLRLEPERAAMLERHLTRIAQAAEELGPDAEVGAIAARAREIRDP